MAGALPVEDGHSHVLIAVLAPRAGFVRGALDVLGGGKVAIRALSLCTTPAANEARSGGTIRSRARGHLGSTPATAQHAEQDSATSDVVHH